MNQILLVLIQILINLKLRKDLIQIYHGKLINQNQGYPKAKVLSHFIKIIKDLIQILKMKNVNLKARKQAMNKKTYITIVMFSITILPTNK